MIQQARFIMGSDYMGQNTEEHNALVEKFAKAWESGDIDTLTPLLAEDMRFLIYDAPYDCSSREDFISYMTSFFASIHGSGDKFTSKLITHAPNNEKAVIFRRGKEPAMMIRIEEKDGMVQEIWIHTVKADKWAARKARRESYSRESSLRRFAMICFSIGCICVSCLTLLLFILCLLEI